MIKILFVCHGNICRSPMAEFVMKDIAAENGLSDEFEIASAATSTEEIGNDIHRGTREMLLRNSIAFSPRAAVQITRRDYAKYDYIIGMDGANVRNIVRICGGDPLCKVFKLTDFSDKEGQDISDPWYTGDFDATYRDVLAGCEGLFESILNEYPILKARKL